MILDPVKGNVMFGAGKDQWAFNLSTIARLYKKNDEANNAWVRKMWGDNFFDEENKKWYKEPVND